MSNIIVSKMSRPAVAAALALLASCGGPPPPPPLPAVPKVEPIAIPSRPTPPGGAAASMLVPAVGVDGVRHTVNTGISPNEAVWNFRSGWNVAALNCMEPKNAAILEGYKQFLQKHGKRLTAVNKAIDKDYKARLGAQATREREAYLTQVYNYFALPPAHEYFCDAAREMSERALLAPPTDADAFALAELPRLEAAFERFFQEMERYRIEVAQWDAMYGPQYGGGQGIAYTQATMPVGYENPARVPLSASVPAPAIGVQSQAVVQPLPDAEQGVSEPVIQAIPESGGR